MVKKIIVVMLFLCLGIILFAKDNIQVTETEKAKVETKMKTEKNVNILMETNYGDIILELYPEKAPKTVDNFLTYIKEKFFDGLIFHRIIPNFMIQGGGFDQNYQQKEATHPPIKNEATNGLSNKIGTIAMARTNRINSATCQFFINVKDNKFLDHRDEGSGYGYAVFGKVIKGMDIVDKIKEVPTQTNPKTHMKDWPVEDVIIKSVTIVK